MRLIGVSLLPPPEWDNGHIWCKKNLELLKKKQSPIIICVDYFWICQNLFKKNPFNKKLEFREICKSYLN